jgi:hypothetical protein
MLTKKLFKHTSTGLSTSLKFLKHPDPIGTLFYVHGYNSSKDGLKITHSLEFCEKRQIDFLSFDLFGKINLTKAMAKAKET